MTSLNWELGGSPGFSSLEPPAQAAATPAVASLASLVLAFIPAGRAARRCAHRWLGAGAGGTSEAPSSTCSAANSRRQRAHSHSFSAPGEAKLDTPHVRKAEGWQGNDTLHLCRRAPSCVPSFAALRPGNRRSRGSGRAEGMRRDAAVSGLASVRPGSRAAPGR